LPEKEIKTVLRGGKFQGSEEKGQKGGGKGENGNPRAKQAGEGKTVGDMPYGQLRTSLGGDLPGAMKGWVPLGSNKPGKETSVIICLQGAKGKRDGCLGAGGEELFKPRKGGTGGECNGWQQTLSFRVWPVTSRGKVIE